MTLTDDEARVVQHLVAAWDAFLKLPVDHQDQQAEFRRGILALQDKVFARPAIRAWNAPAPPAARCATTCADPRWCTDTGACWRTNRWCEELGRPVSRNGTPPG